MDGVFIFLGGNKPSVDFLMNQVEMTNYLLTHPYNHGISSEDTDSREYTGL